MSNEMAPKSINHKDNRNIQTRLDYMLLYRSESKAKIIRTLESWTDTKYAEWYKGIADSKEQHREPPVEDLWITMSYDQFSLFVYGTIQHDTIKQQVDELVALKHIQRRPHPVYPYGPPQYLLNRELVQKELDELEIPPNLFDLAPIFVSPRKKRTPQEKYPQGRGKKPTRDRGSFPPGTGEISHPSNNTTENTDNPSKNEDTGDSAAESTPQPGAVAQPAPDAPYLPDFTTSQGKMASENDAWQAYQQVQPQIAPVCQALASNTPPASEKSEQDSVTPELSTTGVDKRTRQSAKVEPEKPTQATLTGGAPVVSARQAPKEVDISKISLQAHTDYVFQWLEEIKREAKRDQRVGYVKNKTNEGRIKDLITSCWNTDKELTRDNVRKAWRQMWNSKPGNDGFSWKKAGISIDAYCRNYGEEIEKAWEEERRQQEATSRPEPTTPTLAPTTPTVSGLRRWVPPSAQPALAQ